MRNEFLSYNYDSFNDVFANENSTLGDIVKMFYNGLDEEDQVVTFIKQKFKEEIDVDIKKIVSDFKVNLSEEEKKKNSIRFYITNKILENKENLGKEVLSTLDPLFSEPSNLDIVLTSVDVDSEIYEFVINEIKKIYLQKDKKVLTEEEINEIEKNTRKFIAEQIVESINDDFEDMENIKDDPEEKDAYEFDKELISNKKKFLESSKIDEASKELSRLLINDETNSLTFESSDVIEDILSGEELSKYLSDLGNKILLDQCKDYPFDQKDLENYIFDNYSGLFIYGTYENEVMSCLQKNVKKY